LKKLNGTSITPYQFFVVDFPDQAVSVELPVKDGDTRVTVINPDLDKMAHHKETYYAGKKFTSLSSIYAKEDTVKRELDI